jgi:hypothetical protein
MVALAIGLGWLGAYLSQWFYVLFLAPVVLGFVLGGIGWLTVTATKVRHGGVAFLIGLVTGAAIMVAMHYFELRRFQETVVERLLGPLEHQLGWEMFGPELGKVLRVEGENADGKERKREAELVLQRMGDELRPVRDRLRAEVAASMSSARFAAGLWSVLGQADGGQSLAAGPAPYAIGVAESVRKAAADRRALLAEGLFLESSALGRKIEPDIEAALRSWAGRLGVADFLSLKAEQGTVFKVKKTSVPLNGNALWACWGAECLLAGVIAGFVMKRNKDPFCALCERWKEERSVGRLYAPAAEATEHLTSGALGQLSAAAAASGDTLVVFLAICAQCGPEGGIDVRLQKITKKQDEEAKEDLARVTYPGSALAALESLCSPEEAP